MREYTGESYNMCKNKMENTVTIKRNVQKEWFIVLTRAFLTAYALSAAFHAPFTRVQYETGIDYAIAAIYELLGEYDFSFLLIFGLCVPFYRCMQKNVSRPRKPVPAGLGVLFSLFLLVGRSYQETGGWGYCFGSPINLVRFLVALAGYSVLLRSILDGFTVWLEKKSFICDEKHFWSSHAFGKAFAILWAAYFPFLMIAFPGNVCWDAVGQIQQVVGQAPYSLHHPLAHTLLMGGMTELGKRLLDSYDVGLFCYMLLQLAALAAAMAFTIAVLAKRNPGRELLWTLLILYCITPVYSNMASTALKDVPYSSAMVGYIVCLALTVERPERLKNIGFSVGFAALQICVILLRNNGIYVIVLSGMAVFFFLVKQDGWKTVKGRFMGVLAGSVATGWLLTFLLAFVCGAQPGSKGEMLSALFQQTARYVQCYGDAVSLEEEEAIGAVLGDIQELSEQYSIASADPVKARFHRDASVKELSAYLGQWAQGLIKHPGVYMDALLAHIYGWFSPEVSNSLRYEADYDLIRRGGLFPNAEKLLIFYYRFAARFTPLGILENIGLAVWALFFLTAYQKKHGRGRDALAGIPLWISLLVCMASPGFSGHARYGFPILFSIPFLYGFTMTAKDNEGVEA